MFKPLLPLLSVTLIAQTPAPMPQAVTRPHPMGMAAAAQTPEPADSTVLAHLGKRAITYGDFTKWLKVLAGSRADSLRKVTTSRNQAIKDYLDIQVMAAKGRKEKLNTLPEFKALHAALEQQCYTKVLLDEERIGSEGQKLKTASENPSDAEIQAYFQANIDRYGTPEKFTARHILVGVKGAPNNPDKGLTDDEAKAQVSKIQDAIKSGKKLEELTKEYSDDPGSKNNGGLYKDIQFGRFAKEFEAAVRSQELGVVGEPVKTVFGYHLIQVESRTPKQVAEFDKVKDTVKRDMLPERKEKLRRAFTEKIRKEMGFKEEPLPVPTPTPAPTPAPAAPAPVAAPAH